MSHSTSCIPTHHACQSLHTHTCIYRTAAGLCCAMGWPCCLPCSQSVEGYPPSSLWTRWWSPSSSSSLSSVSTGLSSFPILPMASFICFHHLGVSAPHDCHVTGMWLACDWHLCKGENLGWFQTGITGGKLTFNKETATQQTFLTNSFSSISSMYITSEMLIHGLYFLNHVQTASRLQDYGWMQSPRMHGIQVSIRQCCANIMYIARKCLV